MSNPIKVEDSIVARLAAALTPIGVEAIPLPETEKEFSRPMGKGRVTVAYHSASYEGNEGSRYANQLSTGAVVQDTVADVEIVIEAPFRRARGVNRGVLELLLICRKALIGFRPDGCGKLFGASDKFGGNAEGIWTHVLTLRCHSRVAEQPDPVVAPLIKRITNEEVMQ